VNGNIQTASFTVTVIDDTKPIISGVPANITLKSSTSVATTCTQIATWAAVTASDNCAIQSLTSTYASGASFPVGITTVTYKATDVNGNIQTASFTVTVIDDTKPKIVCPANIVLTSCQPTATWALPTATDNCFVASVTQTAGPASGSTFANGTTTTISYKVIDGSGNFETCSFTVTRAAAISATITNNNPVLYFGYTLDQTATITVNPSGGVAPYKVSYTMNRPINCNLINSSGDEV